MKTLVVYFSHAGENYFSGAIKNIKIGNSKVVAEKVQKLLNADIFEIDTVKKYSIKYKECCDEALEEQREGTMPELKNYLSSIEQYDKIVLIYPCWWGTMPQAVFTFLNHYNFNGKQILPICTHEGSGMGRSERDITKYCSSVAKGLAIQGSTVQNCDGKLTAWLRENVLI